ncbi:MAG: DNA polymerase III subunit beta [bacterium]
MNFTIDREVLLENLVVVSRALPTKTAMPILTGIKIVAKDNELLLIANNTDLSIQVLINDKSLTIEEEGVIVYDGKQLLEIVRAQNAKQINMTMVEEKLVVLKAERFKSDLILFDADNYPNMEFIPLTKPLMLDAKIMKQLIKETAYACATSEKRPILTGVNFKYSKGQLTAIATDSFRLSRKYIFTEEINADFDLVIPKPTLDDLMKTIESYNETLEIYFTTNKILFKFNNTLFQSRLLEGAYPDTSRLIPDSFPINLKFNKEDLIGAIERVGVLSPKDKENNYNVVRLFNTESQVCEILTKNNEKGAASEQVVQLDNSEYCPLKIAFSSKYILDALRSFTSTEIILSFSGEVKPFIIQGESDLNLTHLVLPIRVDW